MVQEASRNGADFRTRAFLDMPWKAARLAQERGAISEVGRNGAQQEVFRGGPDYFTQGKPEGSEGKLGAFGGLRAEARIGA